MVGGAELFYLGGLEVLRFMIDDGVIIADLLASPHLFGSTSSSDFRILICEPMLNHTREWMHQRHAWGGMTDRTDGRHASVLRPFWSSRTRVLELKDTRTNRARANAKRRPNFAPPKQKSKSKTKKTNDKVLCCLLLIA